MHFRILKMIATSGFLAALVCTKFVFGPRWESLQRSPRLRVGLIGALLLREKRGEGKGREVETIPPSVRVLSFDFACSRLVTVRRLEDR